MFTATLDLFHIIDGIRKSEITHLHSEQCIQGTGETPVPPCTGYRGFRGKSLGYRGFWVQGYRGLGRPQADHDFGSRGTGVWVGRQAAHEYCFRVQGFVLWTTMSGTGLQLGFSNLCLQNPCLHFKIRKTYACTMPALPKKFAPLGCFSPSAPKNVYQITGRFSVAEIF